MIKGILKLARDNKRVVIVDPETERAFVVLPLSTYERLVDEGAFDEEEFDTFDTIDDDWVAPVPPVDESSSLDESLSGMSWVPDNPGPALARPVQGTPSGFRDDQQKAGHLTEQSLIDSIDRDIAAWKATQEQDAASHDEPAAASTAPSVAPAQGGSASGGSLDELTLTPVPGNEAPMTPPTSAEEERFYIEPVA